MGRLVRGALYRGHELLEEDLTGLDPEDRKRQVNLAFERAPARIRKIDPNGNRSLFLLRIMECNDPEKRKEMEKRYRAIYGNPSKEYNI